MSNSVTIIIRDLNTGAGRSGLSVWLRHVTDSYATNVIQATLVTGKPGVYEAPNVPYNKYKLWVNGTEDNTFGGVNGRWLPEGDEVIRLNGTDWDAKSKKLINLADPTTDTGALNRQTGDGRYLRSGQDLDLSAVEVEFSQGENDANPVILATLNEAIAGIVVTPYQESVNMVRLLVGGTTKLGQVYTTYNDAMGYCKAQTPSATKKYTVFIPGHGIAGATYVQMSENDGGDPPTLFLNDYISLWMPTRDVILRLPTGTQTIQYAAYGRGTINGGTLWLDDSGSVPTIRNIRFINVYIDLTVTSVTFENCSFENCILVINEDIDDTATFTNCIGAGGGTNQNVPSTMKLPTYPADSLKV